METIAVKERPILFSGAMVRAILAGQKSMTRRIVKPQSEYAHVAGYLEDRPEERPGIWTPWEWFDGGRQVPCDNSVRCPYGKPGDRLWVRETWMAVERESDLVDGILFKSDGAFVEIENSQAAADLWLEASYQNSERKGWGNPIFMPRWASRILLEVESVRVERLQDISEEDALSDGGWDYRTCPRHKDPVGSFRELWESINGKGSWDVSPWVWVVSFKVLKAVGEGVGA